MQRFTSAQEALFWAAETDRLHEIGRPKDAKEGPERPCTHEYIFHIMRSLRFHGVITSGEFITLKFFGRCQRAPDAKVFGRPYKPRDERTAAANWNRALPELAKVLIQEGIVELPQQAIAA